MKTISGYLLSNDTFGTKLHHFVLRTAKGQMRFESAGVLPSMREGDMVTVVLESNQIIAISDFTTTHEMQWFPEPPFRSERISLSSWFFINFFLGVLPIAGYCLARFNLEIGTCAWPVAIGLMALMCFTCHRRLVTNYNAGVRNRVQEQIKRTLLDTSLWDVPEHVEGEEWRN